MPKTSVKNRLSEYLARRGWRCVGEEEWDEICRIFVGTSAGYLRRLLRGAGLPLAPLVEGIRQESFEELERTLLAMEREYSLALRQEDRERRDACRRAVIVAKDHARLAMRRAPEPRRALKREMIEWMLVWLEHPQAFPAWLRLRKRSLRNLLPSADESAE